MIIKINRISNRVAHQGSIVQFTIVQKLNQGERKKSAVYLFFLDFFCYFFESRQKSKSQYFSEKPFLIFFKIFFHHPVFS